MEILKKISAITLSLIASLTAVAAGPNAPDIVVSKDGKGQFTTIQEAVLSVRDYKPTRTTIYVKNGTYEEKLLIPANKCDITIIGESQEGVRIVHGDYASLNKMGTFNTWTVRIDGDGIRMENMTIENNAGKVGQAVALHVEGDRCEFAKCRLLGNQDTVFNGGNGSRQYFSECYVEGTTDFLFGPATVVMDDCEIHCKADSYITAASTPKESKWGYVLRRCKVTADAGVKKLYLGRPWREYASVTWIECELPGCIVPEGWHNWGRTENEATSRYAEYGCTGAGAETGKRVKWSRQMTKNEAELVTAERIYKVKSSWEPGYNTNE
jgi:pectinesterase